MDHILWSIFDVWVLVEIFVKCNSKTSNFGQVEKELPNSSLNWPSVKSAQVEKVTKCQIPSSENSRQVQHHVN